MIRLGVSSIMDINIKAGIIKTICLDNAFDDVSPWIVVILNNVDNPRIINPETGRSILIGDCNIFFLKST
jgi:hypothetical protein